MALPIPFPGLHAVILAGGGGTRLGGMVKGMLRVGGVTLLDRVTAALDAGDRPLLVAHGLLPREALGLAGRHVSVPDAQGWGGPLAGIMGAVAALPATTDLLLSVAVDTPFFPPGFAARALPLVEGAEVVVARYAGQPYYTNALWRVAPLRAHLSGDARGLSEGGIRALIGTLGTAWLDWPQAPTGDPFANVNTREDLARIEQRAAQIGVGKEGQKG